MSIPDICKLISQSLAHNLRLAKTDDDRRKFLTAAIAEFGQQVVPDLNNLFSACMEGDLELEKSRTSVLELATLICGGLVRSSNDYRTAINTLEECLDLCKEPQLRSKLVFYTNQLKKRWQVAEPGGLVHNPRAKKLRAQHAGESSHFLFIGGALLACVLFYLFTSIIPRQSTPKKADVTVQPQVAAPQAKADSELSGNQPQQPVATGKTYYIFKDNQGVVHLVDELEKVPPEFRGSMKVDSSAVATGNSTPVTIIGNQVLVPVSIEFRGRSVALRLLLDTGATVTTINENVARNLAVGAADMKPLKVRVADGREVDSYQFKSDSLTVSGRTLTNAAISIVPGSGGKGFDGLLGMNYLKNHRYHVNFESKVIEWGG